MELFALLASSPSRICSYHHDVGPEVCGLRLCAVTVVSHLFPAVSCLEKSSDQEEIAAVAMGWMELNEILWM